MARVLSRVLAALLCIVALSGLPACAAPPRTERPARTTSDLIRDITANSFMAVNIEARRAQIRAGNCPPTAAQTARPGFEASYELDGLPGVRLLVVAGENDDLAKCAAVPRGDLDMDDVEFYRLIEAVRDRAGVRSVVGVAPLVPKWSEVTTLTAKGATFSARDCWVVSESIPGLVPGSPDASGVHVVYLDRQAFNDAVYLGKLTDVLQ